MNKYSKNSESKLLQAHPDLQLIFKTVLQGWDNTILTGHRNEADQTKMFSNKPKLSKVKWPNSKHNSVPSMALDVSPYPIPKKWGEGNRNEYEKFRYFAFYVIGVADALYLDGAIGYKLRWGGDWDMDNDVGDQTFEDLVHFEIVGA